MVCRARQRQRTISRRARRRPSLSWPTWLQKRGESFRAFKLKVGFGGARDLRNPEELRRALGPSATIMLDPNQGWRADEAAVRIAGLAPFNPVWVEEPMLADEPAATWKALAATSPLPLAAGENIRGEAAFVEAIDGGWLRFVQPDVGKWGGISGALRLGAHAATRAVALCPHWLGGGVGLAASMHMLAAAGGAASVAEVDANPNPLREEVCPLSLHDGAVVLGDAPGIGVEPDLRRPDRYRVHTG